MRRLFNVLIFNWKLNDEYLTEIYHPPIYRTFENEYETSDYLFQMHSILILCALDSLKEEIKLKISEEDLKPIFSIDSDFIKAVSCLKKIFDSIFFLESHLNEITALHKENIESESFEGDLRNILEEFLNTLPIIQFSETIRKSFINIWFKFEATKDFSLIRKWIKYEKWLIRRKAKKIAEEMHFVFSINLWSEFKAYKQERNNSSILETISSLSIRCSKAKQTLSTLVSKYIKEKPDGCCAICFTDNGKYYSLSGVNDYTGTDLKIKGWITDPNFQNIIDKLSPGPEFTYAYLTDNVLCYGIGGPKSGNFYILKPTPLATACQNDNITIRNISCCERKIMAVCPNSRKYKFYMRYDPCYSCQPALLPNTTKKITYIASESRISRFTELKIRQISTQGSLPWYTFEKA